MDRKILHVFLGRFAPLHKGHQMIIDSLVKKFGSGNCLLMIGSSTSLNPRTPFSFTARKNILKTIYPDIKIIGIPDTEPEMSLFSGKNLEVWLKELKKLETKMHAEFIFYGGSSDDIRYLSPLFRTKILVNRKTSGGNISATKLREALSNSDINAVNKYLDKRIIGQVTKEFRKFPKSNGI